MGTFSSLRSVDDILAESDLLELKATLAQIPGVDELGVAYAGSLIEGYGTPDSDIDVYVFCKELPHAGAFPENVFLEMDDVNDKLSTSTDTPIATVYQTFRQSKAHADIKFVTLNSLHHLFADVKLKYDASLNNDTIFYLNYYDLQYEDRMLFHRLGNAQFDRVSAEVHDVLKLRPVDEFTLIQFRRRSLSFPKIRDIRGALSSHQSIMAHEIARTLVRDQLMALMHLRGCTNPNEKWLHAEARIYAPEEWSNLRALMALPVSERDEVDRTLNYLELCENFIALGREEAASPRWRGYFDEALSIYESGLASRIREGDAAPLDAANAILKFYHETPVLLAEMVESRSPRQRMP